MWQPKCQHIVCAYKSYWFLYLVMMVMYMRKCNILHFRCNLTMMRSSQVTHLFKNYLLSEFIECSPSSNKSFLKSRDGVMMPISVPVKLISNKTALQGLSVVRIWWTLFCWNGVTPFVLNLRDLTVMVVKLVSGKVAPVDYF